MNPFDPFDQAVNAPVEYIESVKRKADKNVVGYFCSYTPEEIIVAAGAHPFRIFGSDDYTDLADAHFQPYSCSLVRGALGDAISGRMNFLQGVVFPHTCDSMQRLSDMWRMNIGNGFHLDIALPVKLNTKSAADYLIRVFKKFTRDLEHALNLQITDADLINGVKTMNRIRSRLSRLYALRSENPSIIKSSDLLNIVKGSMIMDRDIVAEILDRGIAFLEKNKAGVAKAGKRLILTGSLCNIPDVFNIIEKAGGSVIWDDLCTGVRYFEKPVSLDGDIIESIAERYLNRIVCPAKHAGLNQRAAHIVNIAKKHRADGVIFLLLKFCDPHLFDYPYLRDALEKEGISSMLLEVEGRLPPKAQFKTRCEAFMEMI